MILKELKKAKRAYSRHRSVGNKQGATSSLYIALLNWVNKQCGKLPNVAEKEKWRIINNLTNSTANFQVQPLLVQNDDGSSSYRFSDQEILHEMEQYHVAKSQDQSSVTTIKQSIEDMKSQARLDELDESVMNDPISREEVKLTFNTSTGSPGPDSFMAFLIDKASREIITTTLQLMWNQLWIEGRFLTTWSYLEV